MVGGYLGALEDGQGMLPQLQTGSSQEHGISLTLGTKGENMHTGLTVCA